MFGILKSLFGKAPPPPDPKREKLHRAINLVNEFVGQSRDWAIPVDAGSPRIKVTTEPRTEACVTASKMEEPNSFDAEIAWPESGIDFLASLEALGKRPRSTDYRTVGLWSTMLTWHRDPATGTHRLIDIMISLYESKLLLEGDRDRVEMPEVIEDVHAHFGPWHDAHGPEVLFGIQWDTLVWDDPGKRLYMPVYRDDDAADAVGPVARWVRPADGVLFALDADDHFAGLLFYGFDYAGFEDVDDDEDEHDED